MSLMQRLGPIRARLAAGLSAIVSLTFLTLAAAQTPPGLVITSPVSGATATPGQSLAITVAVAPGSYPPGVAIYAQDPLGATDFQPVTGPTLNFSLSVPVGTSPGPFALWAVSVDPNGNQIISSAVNVQVERADQPTSISPDPPAANLRFVGDSLPLSVFAIFTGNARLDITRSSLLSVTSQNPSVAAYSNGIVTAVGGGKTTLSVQYGALGPVTVAVTVPTSIAGDLNGDGQVDKSDLNIIMAALNTSANGLNDARDLNHDGLINALDARILVTLCTHPGCATQ
jgi:hypothetical protein